MESKKINQLATNVNPQTSDLTTIGDPITGQLKKITWLQVAHLIGAQASVTLQQVTDNGNTTTDPITTGGLTLTNLGTGVPQLTNGEFVSTYGYGLANGVATLDSGGKIPASQLPSSVMEYKGTWNASTNTPTLADGTGDNGDVYLVNVAGSQNLGSGTISFAVGDWVVYNGTIWQKSLNSNAVASVFGRTGTITAQEGDYNIDQLGDVAITSAATNDYLRYNGSYWVNTQFPTFVSSDKLILQVRNNSGATINKGTVVYINGATGGYPTIAKAIANADSTSAQTLGLVQDNISNNSNGVVVLVGQITGLDTSAYAAGTQLYLSGTTAGAYTSTKTLAPTHLVYVGIVSTSNAVNGAIEVKIQNGYELDEIHDVAISSVANNDGLFYESSTSLWKNKSIATVLGYTPEQPLTFSSPLVRTTNTISIPAATGSVNGYLTSTDWTTFNNKQNVLTNPVTGTGTNNEIAYFNATGSTIASLSTATYPSLTELSYVKGVTSAIQTQLNTKQAQLNGTGFVKASGTTITYDNSTYLTTSAAASTYLALTGGSISATSAGYALSITNIEDSSQGLLLRSTDADTTLYLARFQSSATAVSTTWIDRFSIAKNGSVVVGDNIPITNVRLYVKGASTSSSNYALNIADTNGADIAWFRDDKAIRFYGDLTGVGASFSGNISAANLSGTNTGDQTLSGLGGVPTTRTITINGTAFDLSANRTWSVGTIGGSGTANYVSKFTAGSTLGNSLIYDNGTAVMINSTTDNTVEMLQVNGGIRGTSLRIASNFNSGTAVNVLGQIYVDNRSSGGGNRIFLTPNTTSTTPYVHFYEPFTAFNTNGGISIGTSNAITTTPTNSIMHWDANNIRVGINKTNPSTTLDVNGAATFSSTVTAEQVQAISANSGNNQMLLVRNYATSATGNFTGNYTAEIRGASSANLTHAMNIHLNEYNSGRRILDITSLIGTVATFVSNGSVGIGTTSPSYKLHVSNNTNGFISRFTGGTSSDVNIGIYGSTAAGFGSIGTESNHPLNIFTNGVDRVSITSGGYLKASNNGSYENSTGNYNEFNSNTNGSVIMTMRHTGTTSLGGMALKFPNASPNNTSDYFIACADSTNDKAIIYSNGTYGSRTGTYGSIISDIRYKENILEATPKLDDIMKLRVVNYNFIDDTTSKQIGFIAQEMEEVFPSLVFKNDTRKYDEEGNLISGFEDARGLKVGMEFAILVKAIQEQQAQIEELKSKLI